MQADLERSAAPGCRILQRRHQGDERGQSADRDALIVFDRHRRSLFRTDKLHQSGERPAHRVRCLVIAVRTVIAEPADVGDDKSFVRPAQRGVIDLECLASDRIERIDQNVRGSHQLAQPVGSGFACRVQRHTALVEVEKSEIAAFADISGEIDNGLRVAGRIARRRLDLENLGAEIREQTRAI